MTSDEGRGSHPGKRKIAEAKEAKTIEDNIDLGDYE
jgi:hypothetical protein